MEADLLHIHPIDYDVMYRLATLAVKEKNNRKGRKGRKGRKEHEELGAD